MGGTRGYNVWSAEEEEALRLGVKKHGLGAWEVIRRDPEFSVLEPRTGVQLKDKFRNLVKFRHISLEESRALKPKGSGPWSRKHSASTLTRERSLTRTPSSSQLPGTGRSPTTGDEHETEEHAATLLALDRQSQRVAAKNRSLNDFETGSEEAEEGAAAGADPGDGSEHPMRRKRRRSLENRSFGIYDQRRYRSDGTLRSPDDERTATESEGEGGPRSQRARRTGSGGGRGRGSGRGRGGVSVSRSRGRRRYEDSETTTEEEEDEYMEGEGGAQEQPDESYVVDCPCGIKYDDGAMMVECEQCKTWAHIDCLQHQATSNPAVVSYDFNHYMCLACQNKRNQLGLQGLNVVMAGLPMPVGIPTSRASRASKSRMNGSSGAVGDGEAGGTGGLTTRYSRDRTHEAGHVLLGLANGDMQRDAGPSGGADVPARPSSRAGARMNRGEGGSLPLHPVPVGAGVSNPDWMDSLSLFLANTGRPGSALGHRTNSPRAGPTSPSKSAGTKGRDKAGGRGPEVDTSSSQQNLDKLLAAANVQESVDHAIAAAARNTAAQYRNGTDGRASPNPSGMLKRAGSTGPGAGPVVGSSMSAFNSMASLNALTRPASRGPAGELFGDSDDDHHSTLSQIVGASNDIVMQLLSANRAATPSQLFLDQLLRGTTPVQNAAVAGLAAAASAQLQFLQQAQGIGAATGAMLGGADAAAAAAATMPGLAHLVQANTPGAAPVVQVNRPASQGLDELMQLAAASAMGLHPLELRPGTPDTWAMLRGSTPTPDALGLHAFGIQPLAGFPADSQWLLQRSSPALLTPELAALAHSAHLQQQAALASGATKQPQQQQPQQGGSSVAVKSEAAPAGEAAAEGSAPAAKPAAADAGASAGESQAAGEAGGSGRAGAGDAALPETAVAAGAGGSAGEEPAAPAQGKDMAAAGEHTDVQAPPASSHAPAAAPSVVPKTEQGAAAAAAAQAEAAACAAAAAAANAVSSSSGGVLVGTPAMAAVMSELVDRKGSLGALTSAGELAAVVAACGHTQEEFNVDDMLRSNTPAPR